jgi:sulfur dioxygenase
MLFRQLFDPESSTYTYLLADEESRKAAIIDPVQEQSARDLELIRELGLELIYTLETHVHADHVTGSGALRDATGAKVVVSSAAGVGCADLAVEDGAVLSLGRYTIRAITTPGHTVGCVSYLAGGRLFTGDALLIRGTGRTDFQGGSAGQLYDSITTKLFALPDETLVYPAHDYKGRTVSTIGEEKRLNPRLAGKTSADFVQIMRDLHLPRPKKIEVAVPANLVCGQPEGRGEKADQRFLREVGARRDAGAYEVDPRMAVTKARAFDARIVDVRSREEFEAAHLDGAELVPLDTLPRAAAAWDPKTPIITVCRSGKRSLIAARALEQLGFTAVASLRGGMLALGGTRS